MNDREDIDNLGQPLAHRLTSMIEAELLTYREYIPWADSLIERLERPPVWILDLAVTKYRPRALEVIRRFANSEHFGALSWDEWVDEYVASLFLRYERRELSWATLLSLSGSMADSNGGRHACEYFYEMLNAYEEADFAEAVEIEQRAVIASEYNDVLRSVRKTFEMIRAFRVSRK